jgi:acyl carrier protein
MSGDQRLSEEEYQSFVHYVRSYIAELAETAADKISDDTNLLEELDVDSLDIIEMIDDVRKTYKVDVELNKIGMHLLKRKAYTFGALLPILRQIIEEGEDALDPEFR